MNLDTPLLGAGTVRAITESRAMPVLIVGKDKFTRKDLAGVECFNFHACRMLTHIFDDLRVPSLKHVYDKLSPSALAVPRMGAVCLATLGAAFERAGLGDLAQYARKHAPKTNGTFDIVTFDTIKNRERLREQAASKNARTRKRTTGNASPALEGAETV